MIDGGTVTIQKDGQTIDTVKTKDETYWAINNSKGTLAQINVKDQLIAVYDNDLVIITHTDNTGHSKLAFDTEYTVDLSQLISGETTKTFRTKPAPAITGNTITVGKEGNFHGIQGALSYLQKTGATGDWTISVAEGTYHERLAYYGSANVTIAGPEDDNYGKKAVIDWKNNDTWNTGTRARANFLWQGGNLTLKNITLKSTYLRSEDGSGSNNSNEVLYFDSAAYLVAYNASFLGHQDTLLLGNNGGRAWLYKSYIEGDVDFIWGTADVALFEDCALHITGDDTNTGYIFASRTPVIEGKIGKGFVLLNSAVTIDEGIKAYYGRNSGSDTQATVLNNRFNSTPETTLWASAAGTNETDVKGDAAVGYKDYNNTISNTTIDTNKRLQDTWELSERIAKREYNGRHVILNRNYNIKTGAYETKDIWNISAFETEFKATTDESKKNVFIEPVFVPYLVDDDNELKSTTFTASSFTDGDTFTFSITGGSDFATVDNGTVSAKPDVEGDITITVTSANGASDTATTHIYKTVTKASKVSLESITDTTMVVGDVQWITAQLLAADGTETVTDRRVKWTATDGIVFYNDAKGEAKAEWSGDATDKAETIGIYAEKTGTVTITAKSIAYPEATAATITITITDDGKTVGEIPAEGYTFSFIGPDKESKDSLLSGAKDSGPIRDYNVGSTTTEAFSTTLGTGGKYITLLKEHNQPQLDKTYFKVKGNKHNTIDKDNKWEYKGSAKQDEHNMPTKDALLLKGVQGPFAVTVHESKKCGGQRYIAVRFSDGTIVTYDAFANFDTTKGSYTVNYSKNDVTDIAISSSNDVYLDYIKLEQYTASTAEAE